MTPRNRTELVALIGEEALTALENVGCVVVPREATTECRRQMLDAIYHSFDDEDATISAVYTAMLSANPLSPPTSKE